MAVKLGNLVLYDLDELSKKLNVHTATIRGYIRTGRLPGQKVGTKWFVSEESLREFFLKSAPRMERKREK